MFGKKKEVKRRPRTAGSLAQYGLFEVPDNLDDIGGGINDGDENDDDLEAELAALTSDNNVERQRRRNVPRKTIPDTHLDTMVAESMKDIDSNEELSGDDDDPDLLNELEMITGDKPASPEPPVNAEVQQASPKKEDNNNDMDELIKSLQERLTTYKEAERRAQVKNESSRVRRFGRGIKTLEGLLTDVQSGKTVDSADIPPPLPHSAIADVTEDSTETKPPSPVPVALEDGSVPDSMPENTVNNETLDLLKKRQHEYKIAAIAWKKSGNVEEALQYVKIAKRFDMVIAALVAGNEIDLSDMPPSPTMPSLTSMSPSPRPAEKEENETQHESSAETRPTGQEQMKLDGNTIGSALRERLEIYRRTKAIAEDEGNASKARRYGRICKQFEDAIKLHSRGKPVPLDELPVPPGFPPLSTGTSSPSKPQENKQEVPPEPVPESKPSEEEPVKDSSETKGPTPPPRTNLPNKKPTQSIMTRAGKQLMQLQQRQHEIKQAALSAKKDGDLDLARDYLRQAKGMQPLIEASIAGLPVDMNSVPLSPLAKTQLSLENLETKEQDSFTLVSGDDCTEEGGTDQQIYDNLETRLVKQIKWCLSTRDHSKALGDVAGYNRWERLALGYKHDLDMLRVRKRNALPPPQHHYEVKTYAIVQSCTDLGDSDLELSIIRGVNYPREADTYVMFELPCPSDNPSSDRTSTVKESNNPEYEAVFQLNGVIDRKSRQCQRTFKRHGLKCQVWAKGGFFRSDSLLGTVTVKLQPLETQCTLHDSFPLMEGRKAVGGKLEVKLRLRNPILSKQIEQITEKWLTIDH